MDLRQGLLPPVADQRRIDEIGAEIARIADLVHQGLRAEADAAIAGFSSAAAAGTGAASSLRRRRTKP